MSIIWMIQHIVKMSVLHKYIYRLNTILIKIPAEFILDMNTLIKYMYRERGGGGGRNEKSQNNLKNKRQS